MKYMRSAGLVVYYEEYEYIEYLLLHYPAGHWDFPKGKIEEGELEEEAAVRELVEETGLEAVVDTTFCKEIRYIFINHEGEQLQKEVVFFIGRVFNQMVSLSHEHIDFAWLPFEKAYKQLTYDTAKGILESVHRYILETIEYDQDCINF